MSETDVPIPVVFVDTNFLKIEKRHREVFRLKEIQRVNFGGRMCDVPISELVTIDPLAEAGDKEGLAEHRLVDAVVDHAVAGRIKFVTGRETRFESWGLPHSHGKFSRLRDGMVTTIDPPNMPGRWLSAQPARTRTSCSGATSKGFLIRGLSSCEARIQAARLG